MRFLVFLSFTACILASCQTSSSSYKIAEFNRKPRLMGEQLFLSQDGYRQLRDKMTDLDGVTVRINRLLYLDTTDDQLASKGNWFYIKMNGSRRKLILEAKSELYACDLNADNLLLADIMAGNKKLDYLNRDTCRSDPRREHILDALAKIMGREIMDSYFEVKSHQKSVVNMGAISYEGQRLRLRLLETTFPRNYVGVTVQIESSDLNKKSAQLIFESFLTKNNIRFEKNQWQLGYINQTIRSDDSQHLDTLVAKGYLRVDD